MSSDPIRSRLRPTVRMALAGFVEEVANMAGTGANQSCLTCVTFDEPSELCRRYGQRPPARVIAFGCPEYCDEEELPF